MSPQYYILSSTTIHCRSLPLNKSLNYVKRISTSLKLNFQVLVRKLIRFIGEIFPTNMYYTLS